MFEVELDPVDGWQGRWIGQGRARESVAPPAGAGPVDPVAGSLSPAPYLRLVFLIGKPVVSGRLYVTALGVEIPPNVTARVHVPSSQASGVRDAAGNPPASLGIFPGAAGVEEAVFPVGPGTHQFIGQR